MQIHYKKIAFNKSYTSLIDCKHVSLKNIANCFEKLRAG